MAEHHAPPGTDATPEPPRVLFIAGVGRSGTTVVERMLNELGDASAVGESIFLWKRGLVAGERCGCGEPFGGCPFWTAVGAEAFGGWDQVDAGRIERLRVEVDRTRRVPSLVARRTSASLGADQQDYLDHVVGVLQAAATVAGRPPVLIDSSKHVSTAALLSLDPRLDVRMLHMVRDPRGVAHSRMRVKHRPEAGNVAMSTISPQKAAARWVSDNLGYEALAARGVPTLRVRYEDVMAEPRRALVDIARFAGAAASEEDLAFLDGRTARFSTPMHSAAGNPMRFAGQEMEIRMDTSWREAMAAPARRTVAAITAPMLLRYGYPLRVQGRRG